MIFIRGGGKEMIFREIIHPCIFRDSERLLAVGGSRTSLKSDIKILTVPSFLPGGYFIIFTSVKEVPLSSR